MRQGGRILAAGRVRSKKKNEKTRNLAASKTHPLKNARFQVWKFPMDMKDCSNTKMRYV